MSDLFQPAGLAALATIVASVIGLVAAILRFWTRLAKLEFKVETMWGFQMRRAFSEAVQTGIATLNSPLNFTDESRAALMPLQDQLQDFWATLRPASDSEALLRLEAQFGDELVRRVCIPCGLSHGACLLLALTIAKQSSDINFRGLATA